MSKRPSSVRPKRGGGGGGRGGREGREGAVSGLVIWVSSGRASIALTSIQYHAVRGRRAPCCRERSRRRGGAGDHPFRALGIEPLRALEVLDVLRVVSAQPGGILVSERRAAVGPPSPVAEPFQPPRGHPLRAVVHRGQR